MKRILCLMLTAVVILLCFAGCNGLNSKKTIGDISLKTKVSDFSGCRIGCLAGSIMSEVIKDTLPDSEFFEFSTNPDAIMALSGNKIDAFVTENTVYQTLLWEGITFSEVEEPVEVFDYGYIFAKGKNLKLQGEINEFIKKQKENGGIDSLSEKWFSSVEPTEFADYESLNGKNGTIRVAICSEQKPFAYLKNSEFVGFDIDFFVSFCEEYGYTLEITDSAFDSIITGVTTGVYDIGASGICISEESKETFDFSESYYTDKMILIVNKSGTATRKSLDDFDNATLGVIVGSIYDGYSRELFPDAKIEAYQSFPDLFQCIRQGKVDGFLLDIPNYNAAKRTDKELSYISVPDYNVEIGYAFDKEEKGDKLKAQMDVYLAKLRADGTLDEIWDKWCGEVEPTENIVVPDLSANEKELKIAFDSSRKPFVYMLNNEYAGFEVEILYMFCKEYGYNPKIEDAQWTAGVAGLKEGKYDIVSCGIYITEERKESVNFCEPYMIADIVMVTYGNAETEKDFFASVKEGFEKTFIREDRWKLITEGVLVTMLISFFSVIGGSVLGFAFYLLSRSKLKAVSVVVKKFAKIYSVIISGTPTLVVLMILFYIVFGKTDISGVSVAIIGFIMTFGSFVYNQLDVTVENVDKGQTEAAYALGYNRNKTFFRIILPQALRMFIPAYTGEIVGLIQATSIVGYIAVNDLTRMGDIIRSNTYEAFFPLIAVAVIYFVITWGVAGLLGIANKKIDPRKRKNKNILKGVVR